MRILGLKDLQEERLQSQGGQSPVIQEQGRSLQDTGSIFDNVVFADSLKSPLQTILTIRPNTLASSLERSPVDLSSPPAAKAAPIRATFDNRYDIFSACCRLRVSYVIKRLMLVRCGLYIAVTEVEDRIRSPQK